MNPSTTADALIVGGGVIGMMTARELAKAGLRVTLLDRQAVGRESSWAGGGILSPLYPWRAAAAITALSRWSQHAYPALIEELHADTGIDPEWLPSGLLINGCEDVELAQPWCRTYGVRCEETAADAWSRLEPGLAIAPSRPLYFPDIAQVRNPRLLRALRADLVRRNVRLLEHQELVAIERNADTVTAVRTRNDRFTAKTYIVACGAWSRHIGADLTRDLPVEPVKGQMLVFAAEPGLIGHIVLHDGRYLIPRKDGKVLVGSTVEYTGFDKATSEEARSALIAFAHAVVPALAAYPVEKHWAGLRPGSPEGIPIIGAHPELSNLYFNCGQFRNGFALAPASTRLLADRLLTRPPIVPAEAYDMPSRLSA